MTAVARSSTGTLSGADVKLSFAGANPRPRLEPFGRLDAHVSDFPVTANAFDASFNDGWDDAFVALLSASGTGLEYATFLGGKDDEGGRSIALDSVGHAFVTGDTFSDNFPTTAGALDVTTGWPDTRDHFIAKLAVAPPPTVLARVRSTVRQ